MDTIREHIFPSGNKLQLYSDTHSFCLTDTVATCDCLAIAYLQKQMSETCETEWWTNNSELFHPSQQKLAEAVYSYRLSEDEQYAFKATNIGQNIRAVHAKDLIYRYDNIIPWIAPSIDAVKYVEFVVRQNKLWDERSMSAPRSDIGSSFFMMFEDPIRKTAHSNKGIMDAFYNYLIIKIRQENSRYELMQTVWTFFNFT